MFFTSSPLKPVSDWRESLSYKLRKTLFLGFHDQFWLHVAFPWRLAACNGSVSLHLWEVIKPMWILSQSLEGFPSLSPPLPDRTATFFIWMGWVLFMMEPSWIASFFKNYVKQQKDSASYIRMDKENWTQLWLVSSYPLFWNFSPVFQIPFQTRSVHRPVYGNGPLRLPNVPRNPSQGLVSEFLRR